MILKAAYLYESAGTVDPGTNRPIRTTRRVRDAYRKSAPENQVQWQDLDTGEQVYGPQKGLPNFYASQIIERAFASRSSRVGAHFDLDDGSIGEIRIMMSPVTNSYDVFVSSIKESTIDIISFQRGYYKKRGYAKLKDQDSPPWYKRSLSPLWYSK